MSGSKENASGKGESFFIFFYIHMNDFVQAKLVYIFFFFYSISGDGVFPIIVLTPAYLYIVEP